MIRHMDGFEAYDPIGRMVERDLRFTLDRTPRYKLGDGKGGVMYVNGDRRLMAFAGPGTREGLRYDDER